MAVVLTDGTIDWEISCDQWAQSGETPPAGFTVKSNSCANAGAAFYSPFASFTLGDGTVVSVGLTMPASVFDVDGSPITDAGTFEVTFIAQNANKVFAGPVSGADAVPTFRALVAGDIPNLSALNGLLNLTQIAQGGATTGQVLTWNGTNWTAATPSVGIGGSIAAGQIAYGSGVNTIAGENNLWWDAANDRLGVGTNSPGGRFHLLQPSTGNQLTKGFLIQDPTATGTPIFRMVAGYPGNYDGYLLYYRNSLLCQMIEDNGAVSYFNNLKLNENSLLTAIQHSNSWLRFVNSAGTRYAELVGWTDLRLATNGFGADVWLIASTGNMGIGTNTPARKLHVNGAARITGSAGTPSNILGRDASGDIANLTLGAGLSITGGALNVSTGVTGSGTAGRVALWSGTSALTSDAELLYDSTNNRLQVGTGTASAAFNAFFGAVSSAEPFRASGNISGNMITSIANIFNAGGGGNNIFQLVTGGANAGDPVIQMGATGGTSWAIGIDNSDGDKFKITPDAALPGEFTNASFVVTAQSPPRYGFNVDSPAYELDMQRQARFGQVQVRQATYAAPTAGAGAGTGATFVITNATGNSFLLNITTGTTPTLNGNIVTVTIPWFAASAVNAVFCAYNDLAANHIQRFKIGSTSNNNITITNCNTALSASSTYALSVVFFG